MATILSRISMLGFNKPSSASTPELQEWIQQHGDLLFDLCESLIQDPVQSLFCFRRILQKLKGSDLVDPRQPLPWLLRITLSEIFLAIHQSPSPTSAAERLKVDSLESADERLKQVEHFIRRFPPFEQALIRLRGQHGLGWEDLEIVLQTDAPALKMRHAQCLEQLTRWIYA